MNQHSSRSHTLLQLSIEQRWDEGGDAEVVRSKINLVDLAGSEVSGVKMLCYAARWHVVAGLKLRTWRGRVVSCEL